MLEACLEHARAAVKEGGGGQVGHGTLDPRSRLKR
jgi:hypothetical protein